MAHHQWGGAQPRVDPQDPTQQLIRDLIAAMGASIENTNNQVGLLAQQIQGVIYHGGFGGGAGGVVQGAGGANDQGYRALKPKKDQVTSNPLGMLTPPWGPQRGRWRKQCRRAASQTKQE